jgi:NAD(P)-dependent dehydrogenase (short-subunit alcohol dehydrogenase family)
LTTNEDALQTTQSDADWIQRADAGVPLGRILRPSDVAVTVIFLLSDASAMTTGTVVELHPEYAEGMISLQATDAR